MEGLEREKLELKRDWSAANSELRYQSRQVKALTEKMESAEKSHREVRLDADHACSSHAMPGAGNNLTHCNMQFACTLKPLLVVTSCNREVA